MSTSDDLVKLRQLKNNSLSLSQYYEQSSANTCALIIFFLLQRAASAFLVVAQFCTCGHFPQGLRSEQSKRYNLQPKDSQSKRYNLPDLSGKEWLTFQTILIRPLLLAIPFASFLTLLGRIDPLSFIFHVLFSEFHSDWRS